jgi:hypothetical protein
VMISRGMPALLFDPCQGAAAGSHVGPISRRRPLVALRD